MPTLDWNLKDCLSQCSPKTHQQINNVISKYKKVRKSEINLDDVIDAYEVMARIITVHGSKYLPIFERLHRETLELKSKKELLNIAKNITDKKLSTIFNSNN